MASPLESESDSESDWKWDELKWWEDFRTAERIMYGNAYHTALEVGKARNTRIPVMIVGRDRSGKTSLKKHLLGMPFDNEEPSTDGIEVDVVELTEENAKDAWKRKNVKHLTMNKDEAKESIFEQTAKVSIQRHRLEVLLRKQKQKPKLSGNEIENIKSLQKNLTNKKKASPVIVFLHDFAGQDVFYDTHFYFLRLQSVYIVVHDLTIPLEDVAQPRFKANRINAERNLKNPLLATNLQWFLSWLTLLERLKDTTAEALSEDLEGCEVSPALIVFTNSDRFNGKVDEVMQIIRDILTKKGYSNVFIDFYVTDNSSSGKGKDQVRELRGKVYELCKKILEKQRPVPIRWLQFEASLTNKLVEEKVNYISVKEARETAKACKVENIEAAIKSLHHRGVIVHHPGSSVVVLNPPWLMNILTKVISVPEEESLKEGPNRRLITKGILMQSYLEGKQHGEILKELLIQFGLICPWKHDDGPAFIVPSVAPLMEEGEGLEKKLSTSPVAPVFFNFKLGYLLPGLFTKFVVRMINTCREFLRLRQPHLFCNYTLLSFMYNDHKFDVYIIKQLARIKIGVVPKSSISPRYCNMFTTYLKQVMIKSMQNIKHEEELFYRNVDICLAVKCSECFGEHNPCLDHGDVNCKQDDCGHFWFLEELQKCSEDPVCRGGSILETREFSLARVKSWIYRDEIRVSSPDYESTESSSHAAPISDLVDREIARIADRIPSTWQRVAFATGKFERHEVDNILRSRPYEDQSEKARVMLFRYKEKPGTREDLVCAIREVGDIELADRVHSRYFIDNAN